MSHPYGRRPLRTFALVIALPTLLLYCASAMLVIGALAMMAREIDRVENSRGVVAMHAALDNFLSGLSDAVSDEGTWNEAYLNTVVNSDAAWMDTTWGTTARLGNAYDTVIVTDSGGIIQFGENNAGGLKGDIASFFPSARAMLGDLDKGITATGDATVISNFASDELGPAGLAAISIHQTSPAGSMNVPRPMRRVLWIAKHMTPSLLQDIAVRYQTPLASLVTSIDPDASSIGLIDAEGSTTGTIEWIPDRPGEAAFGHAALLASAAFFGIGLALLLWLGLVRRGLLKRVKALAMAAPVVAAPAPAPQPLVLDLPLPHPKTAGEASVLAPIDGVTATEFAIEYEPIFDLRAETLIGAEAKLHWTKPDGSTLALDTLPPAPGAVLLDRVGILALRHAGSELAPLLGLMLSIPATPGQLLSPAFAEKIVATLGATHMPAPRLQICLDAALLPPLEQIAPVLAALRNGGISIAFGNFTLEPGNLDYVRFGLADRICLAPQMIAGIGADPVRLALVEATIETARNVRMGVTVRGVERKEDVAPLLRLGCRDFQGPLFAPPMSISAFTNLVLARPGEVRKAG